MSGHYPIGAWLRRCGVDMLIIVLLAVAGISVGRAQLATLNTGRSAILGMEILYGPSVMLATGRGFYQPDTNASPELRAFLRNETEHLDPSVLPDDLPEVASTVAAYHRYLLYTVAAFWRVFGIRWASLELLSALLLGWCAVAGYGLFRLGMGRLLSAVMAIIFMLSPPMLTMLPHLRDLGKAPFILTAILLLALLIKNKPSPTRTTVYAALLGLDIGIGMGFRQDIILFIPPAFVVAALAVFRAEDGSTRRRWATLALFVVCLLGTAWPMLGRMEGGAQPYHPLVQGYSMKRMDNLGIAPASYQPLASGQDNYVFAMLYDYYRRVNDAPDAHFEYNSPGAEAAGRQWLLDMGIHFPADILTRGYASVLRTLRYADAYTPWFTLFPPHLQSLEKAHLAFASFMHHFGVVLGILALMIIGARNLTVGLGVLVFTVYIFGYVGLQCEFRHAFHLCFVPFWVTGFLAATLVEAARRKLLTRGKGGPAEHNTAPRRLVLFSVCALALVMTPLYGLRLYQHHTAAAVIAPVLDAPYAPVRYASRTGYGWTLFSVDDPAHPMSLSIDDPANMRGIELFDAALGMMGTVVAGLLFSPPVWHTRARYMMVEFDASEVPDWLYIHYESQGSWNNFSQVVRLPSVTGERGVIRYFFPVYELTMPDDRITARNIFVGIGLPQKDAYALQGIYEITDFSQCRFLMHLMARGESCLHQRLRFLPDPLSYYHAENDAVGVATLAEAAARFGSARDAVFFFRTVLLLSKDPSYRFFIARRLTELGALDAALEAALDDQYDTDDRAGEKANLLLDLGMAYSKQAQTENMERAFMAAGALATTVAPERLMDAAAVLKQNNLLDAASHLYYQAMLAHPEYSAGAAIVDMQHESEQRLLFWQQLTREQPHSVLPWLRLGAACEDAGNPDAAKQAYAQAYRNNPVYGEAVLRHIAASPDAFSAADIITNVERAVTSTPTLAPLAATCLEQAARFFSAQGDPGNARMLYEAVIQYAPDSLYVHINAADALMATGDIDKARDMLAGLLQGSQGEGAADALQRLLSQYDTPEARLLFWQEQAANHPDKPHIALYHGIALADSGQYEAAGQLFETLAAADHQMPELDVYLRVAALAAGKPQASPSLHRYVTGQHPELTSLAAHLLLRTVDNLVAGQRLDDAATAAREATMLAADMEATWLALGGVLEAQGDYQTALEVYRGAFGSVATSEQLAVRTDMLFSRLQQPEKQRETWAAIVSEHPDNPTALLHLAMTSETMGAYEAARDAYTALMEMGRDTGNVRVRLGGVLACLNDVATGMKMIQDAVAADSSLAPAAAWICQNAGRALREQALPEEAALLYRLASDYAPDDPFPPLQLGELLQLQGNAPEATGAWRKTVLIAPESPAAAEAARRIDGLLNAEERISFWRNLTDELPGVLLPRIRYGCALADNNDASAVPYAEQVAQENPDHPEAQLLHGIALCRAGEIAAGISRLDTLLTAQPQLASETAGHMFAAATAYAQSGQYDRAVALLEAATRHDPADLTYTLALGEALLAQDKPENAAAQFQKVLMAAPESPRSARMLDEAYRRLNAPEAHRRAWQTIADAHPDAALPRQRLREMSE